MTIARMIELLEIEHECMLRKSHDACDSHCGVCELVQDDGELHEMYIDVIALLKAQEPVVRCKDCKNGEPARNAVGQAVIKCYEICDLCKLPRLMELDWYCADGERREDDG